jgi:glutamate-1-semialdehyde 2,1-aminomutase
MRYELSRRHFERARRTLAGGVSSSFRSAQRPTPLYFSHGDGARIVDVDGQEYVDYVLGWGPLILGHSPPAVVEAVRARAARAQTFGAQHELEFLVAEAIARVVPGVERVCFSTTGTEAVQVALRLARAFTGRQRVIKFEGHYHGWVDGVYAGFRDAPGSEGPRPATAGQSRHALEDLIVLPWNDLEAVDRALAAHRDDVAAIIMEPVLANSGMIAPRPGYLEGVRGLCDRHGVVLIFDEVITGFRVALGGARELYGVLPDLSVYGKALAGGFPVSAVAGRAAVMDLVGTRVAHAGTMNGHPVALAAALATLTELERGGGRALARVAALGDDLQRALRATFAAHGVPALVQGLGSVFWTFLTDRPGIGDYRAFHAHDGARNARLAELLADEGVLVMESGRWYVSTAHTSADLDQTLEALERALDACESVPERRRRHA